MFKDSQNIIIVVLLVFAIVVPAVGAYLLLSKPAANIDSEVIEKDSGISFTSSSTATTTNSNDPSKDSDDGATDSSNIKETSASLHVGKEVPGQAVFVDLAILEEPGYVVIYEASEIPTGQVLGSSLILSKGEHTNVPVRLSRPVADGEVFDAFIHSDDGDGTFSIMEDPPFRDADGRAIVSELRIEALTIAR